MPQSVHSATASNCFIQKAKQKILSPFSIIIITLLFKRVRFMLHQLLQWHEREAKDFTATLSSWQHHGKQTQHDNTALGLTDSARDHPVPALVPKLPSRNKLT